MSVLHGLRSVGGSGFYGWATEWRGWSSTVSGTYSYYRNLYESSTSVLRDAHTRSQGFSVRCVRNKTDFYYFLKNVVREIRTYACKFGKRMPAVHGYRVLCGGDFHYREAGIYWWTSVLEDTYAWYRALDLLYTSVHRRMNHRSYGFSVRCVGN